MSQYLLAPHVHLCVTDDHVVLLDLKRDKYVGVGRAQMGALQACVKGWPALQGAAAPAVRGPAAPAQSLPSKLLQSGMLTTDLARGKAASPISLPRPESSLIEPAPDGRADLFDARPAIGSERTFNFIRACTAARMSLRFRSIAAVVARATARKAQRIGSSRNLDLAAARAHVAAFVHLRPLLFTAKDACLFDSLAMVRFLSHYGEFPMWVFGVQTGPFAAHCWVQHQGVVFNDTPDHVRRYTPILAV